jgi:hypothetical protein
VQGKREADLKQVEDLQAGVEARDEEADKRAEVSAAVRSSSDDANTTPLRVVKP